MTESSAVLERLYGVIEQRRGADPKESYVAKMFAKGRKKIAEKVGEEAVETVIAAVDKDRGEVIYESADLLFALLVLWAQMDVRPEQVFAELARREGTSGIAEKAARKDKTID
ncbi:MAG: phosphoribosyl-ATP diphosphatase [Proteobacteria bacterium]|nr:phosphoribosyl-ATP diphosphatase [Pseudomonadota bacterium]MDA1057800.1 phosphoribosyl-ATP diphosphatase [Pseudomonadota bacterium]